MKKDSIILAGNNGLNNIFNLFNENLYDWDYLLNNKLSNSYSTNIKESEKNYQIEFQVPGFKKEDIEINIEDNILKISGNVENSKEDENIKYNRREFYKKSFAKSYHIPDDVNEDSIKAECKDGILTINIDKKELQEPKKKSILIN
jgi:HSP20 family protein